MRRRFQSFVFALVAGTAGCAWMIQSRPGEVHKDVVDGWQLSGILIPIGGVKVVRIDAQQIKQSPTDADLSLFLNTSDHPIDCNSVTLLASPPVSLTKVRYQEAGAGGQSVIGRVSLAELKSASAHGLKVDWCHVVIALDDAQIGTLKEFVQMAGG